MRRSKKTSKLHVTGLCEGNSPVTDEFPTQRASDAENVSFDDVIMPHCREAVDVWLRNVPYEHVGCIIADDVFFIRDYLYSTIPVL